MEQNNKKIEGKELLKLSKDTDVNKLIEDLKAGVKELVTSGKYIEFLNFRSSLYNYSVYNCMLIAMQRPDATYVGSFNFWKRQGRYVKKGEHGISILAPIIKKEQVEVPELNSKGEPVVSEDGKVKTYIAEKDVLLGFKFTTVFDVSQTDGKPIPNILNELTGNSSKSENIIEAIKNVSKAEIRFENFFGEAYGFYDHDKNEIVVRDDVSLDQKAKTLVHEYAHYKLHSSINNPVLLMLYRSDAEIQAESVAYVVLRHFGLDTSEYSFGYITSWASGRTIDEMHETLDLITKASKNIISEIEGYLSAEYALLQQKEGIKNMIKEAGFKPTEKLIKNIMKMNQLTNKNLGMKELRDLYLNIDKLDLSAEEKDCIKSIGDDFKKQEVKMLSKAKAKPDLGLELT